MSKTNTGLVAYVKAQLGKPYWYGTFGNTATQSLLNSKTSQYPSHYQSSRQAKYKSQIGQRVHDCIGLVKGYLWSTSATATPKYNSAQDVSADRMLKLCNKKGKIATIPEIPGVLVFSPGHVGVYIGNGWVIEARGFAYGVVKTELSARGWTDWGMCPWITYPATTPKPAATTATQKVDAAQKKDNSLAGRYKITASSLHIRAGAGITKKSLGTLKNGTIVTNYGYYSMSLGTKWLYVKTSTGVVGFCSSKYLKKN